MYGENLNSTDEGQIRVVDNGIGMNAEDFEKGFLRVASRLKEEGERRSHLYKRRYTGAKGIGRLAAHKLARRLEVYSVTHGSDTGKLPWALEATINWDEIERFETLEEIDSTDAIDLRVLKAHEGAHHGTTLILKRLRRAWTQVERARFFAEVQSSDPPSFLRKPLPSSVIADPLLFAAPVERDQSTEALGSPFQIILEGEFAAGEEYWALVANMANWVLEISAGEKRVDFAIAPTRKTLGENPEAKGSRYSVGYPAQERRPQFDARILVREGRQRRFTRDQRVWAHRASGIRVYMEGFRVLPYGEPEDDWLSLDYDYTRRPRQFNALEEFGFDTENDDPDAGLMRVPSNNYHGAVFLTQEGCPDMRLLVNREGFVPEASFYTLVRILRLGIDLLTRERAAANLVSRKRRREERLKRRDRDAGLSGSRDTNGKTGESDKTAELLQRIRKASDRMKEVEAHLSGDVKEVSQEAIMGLDEANARIEDLNSERMLLYVLASVGTQMAAFVHEINVLLGSAQTIEQALERFVEESQSFDDRHIRTRWNRLRGILRAVTELKRGLERQASFLTDVITVDALRRRSRQRLRERFDYAVRLLHHQAERMGIRIENRIPPELRSPPMFPAEVTSVFANLLSNAVKAAGKGGSILASASGRNDQVQICVQNTGKAVELDEAERWFKPFQSTTTEVDSVLGQGMGLGLTITRNLLDNYGASVRFVEPDSQFATAVEIILPKRS